MDRDDLFRKVDPSYFKVDDAHHSIESAKMAYEDGLDNRLASARLENSQTLDKRESLAAKFHDINQDSQTVKRILELLCDEAGFLVPYGIN